MIHILQDDRSRIYLAAENDKIVYPCQLAVSQTCLGDIEYSLYESQYPKVMTYDIILFQPSLFGGFHRADNHEDKPTYYTIPEKTFYPAKRLEYLKRLDDGTQVREFQNVQHVTSRSRLQAVNPYLMVMNAREKLQYWKSRLPVGSSPDPVFRDALDDCVEVVRLINRRIDVYILMNRGKLSSIAAVQKFTDAFSSTKR